MLRGVANRRAGRWFRQVVGAYLTICGVILPPSNLIQKALAGSTWPISQKFGSVSFSSGQQLTRLYPFERIGLNIPMYFVSLIE